MKGILQIEVWEKKTCISFGKVALNNIVCRTPGGGMSICSTIFLICGSKPMSSIRSASSRAKYLIICNDTLALSSKSTNLPGVATRMSTPLSSSRSCPKILHQNLLYILKMTSLHNNKEWILSKT